MHNFFTSKGRRSNGFTLVEIIFVLAILGIIASIGTTLLLRSLPNMRLSSATRDIHSAMMQAKTDAIRRGENVTLLFDTANNSFVMFLDRRPSPAFGPDPVNDNDGQLDPDETVIIPATPFPLRITYDPVISGADGVLDGVTFATNTNVFSMRGIPIGAGAVALRAVDDQGNTVRQRRVTVSLAGRISVQ